MNFAQIIENSAQFFPNNVAVIDGNREVTYREFDEESSRIASSLVGMGIRPGDCVCLCAPNSFEWLSFYFGVLKAGGITLTPSTMFTEHELIPIIDETKPKALFTTETKLEQLNEIRRRDYLNFTVCGHGDISHADLVEKGSSSFSAVERNRKDVATILYTGGTTGVPKGILTTHENLYVSTHNIAFNERSTEKDREVCFLPMDHLFAQVHVIASTLYTAGGLVIHPSFDLEKLVDSFTRHRVTKIVGVPTIYVRLLEVKSLQDRLESVRYCFSAGASMAAEVVQRWKDVTGLNINEAYGLTESTAMCTFNHYHRHVIGAVGTPVNLVEVQIRDLDGNVLDTESKGEICILGPNVMKGYLNRPELNQTTFWGEWLRSGDIGFFDEDGYLHIVDRIKEMIITGGENVYPREVENVLYTRRGVKECAVIGMPDNEYGEKIVAFIIPQEGYAVDPVAFKSHLKSRLAPYKVPKDFIAVSEFPRSSTGKILKREMLKMYPEYRRQ
jgi:long-chain acyl-CoA synthetase